MKQSKSSIYNQYGIAYDRKENKIYHKLFGWINPLLINGNDKLGKGVYTFSTLPTNKAFNVTLQTPGLGGSIDITIKGTCPCSCAGCYATKGRYTFDNVIEANARKTYLVLNDLDFVTNAIIAQIKADRITLCRIHASGDFVNDLYIEAWKRIVKECPETVFWTYTKNIKAEAAFDDLDNINVVKSIIPGYGFNFGHCDYIIKVYNALKAIGKSVYICRCGIDKNQHCTNCKGCSKNEVVLFIEHSTSYKAAEDPCFEELKQIIEAQDKTVIGK